MKVAHTTNSIHATKPEIDHAVHDIRKTLTVGDNALHIDKTTLEKMRRESTLGQTRSSPA